MNFHRISKFTLLALALSAPGVCAAQDAKSWSSTSRLSDTNGAANGTRTTETHTESGGRTIDRTSVERIGPDGRYVPYQESERESVRVNDTTKRNVERMYGRGPNGERVLIQETQEETRKLAAGEERSVRTVSNPDGNGALQLVHRETSDSREVTPGVRETKTTVFSPDANGGLAPSMQIEERQQKGDAGSVKFRKSTSLSDGAGHWSLGEVREGTTKKENGASTTEERVLRPDAEGKLGVVERTVSRQSDAVAGEKRDTVETYSTNVPGVAGDNGLQLVERASTVRRTNAGGAETTTRMVERPNPGDPGAGLRVTQEAIDIVRPGANGIAQEQTTISTLDANGNMTAVSVDIGKSDKPASVTVDTKPSNTPAPAKQK